MQFGLDRNGEVFCVGWVVARWNSVEQFKRDNKPFRVEIVKAGSPRCEQLMSSLSDEKKRSIPFRE